jgi:hypothetical protein
MVCRRLVASILLTALTLTGCTTMQTIRPASPGGPPFGTLQAGDTVVVVTRGGDQTSFAVQRIEGETLVARDGRRYLASDLVRVERKAVSRAKTAWLIAGIGAGVFMVVALTVGVWLGENSQ